MKEASVPKNQAEKTALAKVPQGTIKSGELEKENGHLVWSFDIAKPGTKDITEVQVDAKSGKIVEAEYYAPLLAHAAMEPPAALAVYQDGKVEVWAPSQSPVGARDAIASFL